MPTKPPRTSLRLTRRPRKSKAKHVNPDWPLDDPPPDLSSEVNVDKWRDYPVFRVVGYDLVSEDARRRMRLPPSS